MAVSQVVRRAGPFDGDGVTASFPFVFKTIDRNDIKVLKYNTNTNEEEVLTSGYTVTVNLDQENSPGGVVTLSSPLQEGYVLSVMSDIEMSQDVVLTNRGGFYPEIINSALDKVTMLIQQLSEEVSRCLRVRATSGETPEDAASRLESAQDLARQFSLIAEEAAKTSQSLAVVCQAYSNTANEYAEQAEASVAVVNEMINGVGGALNGVMRCANNLADVADKQQARSNLGLGSMAMQEEANYALRSDLNGYLLESDAEVRFTTADAVEKSYVSKSYASSNFVDKSEASTFLKKSDATQFYISKTEAEMLFVTVDASQSFLTKASAASTYLTISDAQSTYLKSSVADDTYLKKSDAEGFITVEDVGDTFATVEFVNAEFVKHEDLGKYITEDDLGGYATKSDLSGYATKSDLSGYATTASLSTYATKSELGSYATTASLSNYATTASLEGYATTASLASYATIASLSAYAKAADLDAYAKTSDLSTYAKTSDLSAYAKNSALSAYVPISGSRGAVAGYQQVSVLSGSSIEITKSSTDDSCVQTSSTLSVSVPNGDSGVAWQKTVSFAAGGLDVSLGSNWSWPGGDQPEFSNKGMLILYWNGLFGVADFVGA